MGSQKSRAIRSTFGLIRKSKPDRRRLFQNKIRSTIQAPVSIAPRTLAKPHSIIRVSKIMTSDTRTRWHRQTSSAPQINTHYMVGGTRSPRSDDHYGVSRTRETGLLGATKSTFESFSSPFPKTTRTVRLPGVSSHFPQVAHQKELSQSEPSGASGRASDTLAASSAMDVQRLSPALKQTEPSRPDLVRHSQISLKQLGRRTDQLQLAPLEGRRSQLPHRIGDSVTPAGVRREYDDGPVGEVSTGSLGRDLKGMSSQDFEQSIGTLHLDGAALGRWVMNHLENSLGGPQRGPTGIDPRIVPVWGSLSAL